MTDDDGGIVQITLRTVWENQQNQFEAINAINAALQEIKAEIKGSLMLHVSRVDELSEQVKDHEARIRVIEQSTVTRKGMYALVGLCAALAGSLAAVVALFI